jgi:hypothetical protein
MAFFQTETKNFKKKTFMLCTKLGTGRKKINSNQYAYHWGYYGSCLPAWAADTQDSQFVYNASNVRWSVGMRNSAELSTTSRLGTLSCGLKRSSLFYNVVVYTGIKSGWYYCILYNTPLYTIQFLHPYGSPRNSLVEATAHQWTLSSASSNTHTRTRTHTHTPLSPVTLAWSIYCISN